MAETTMREYQAMLIVDPEIKPEAQEQFLSQIGEQVTRHGGRMIESAFLGRRRLSFKIGRHVDGNYLQARLEMPTLQVESLKQVFHRMEGVIRAMVMTTSDGAAAPFGAVASSQSDSDD